MTYALNRIIRTTLNWTMPDGSLAQNVFHEAAVGGAATQADVDAAAVEGQVLFTIVHSTVAIEAFVSSEISLASVDARTIDPANPLAAHVTSGIAGTNTHAPVPLESAAVTTLYTALASRRGRGRTFLPGLGEDLCVHGRIPTGTANLLAGCYNAWLTYVSTAGNNVVVVWSHANNLGYEVTNCLTRTTLHHQRRRNS